MNLIKQPHPGKTAAELRKYGFIMFTAFAVISALLFLRHRPAWTFTAVPSVLFLGFAVFMPRMLAPVEKLWMKLAAVLGFIMTNVLLILVFFFAITPTGLLLRLLGKGQIKKGFSKDIDSYWLDVDKTGPCSRPDKPY